MKTLLIVLGMLLSVAAWAATDTGTEADHAQLRQMLLKAQEAVNRDRPEDIEALLHEDYVITVMNQEVVAPGRTLRQLFHDWFKKPGAVLKSMHTEPKASIQTNIYDGRFGVCYGTSVDTYELSNGQSYQFDSNWTATVIKEGNEWKLLALHVGVNPIENPLIDGYRKGLGFGGVVIEIMRLFE
jgi:hypothetical protein